VGGFIDSLHSPSSKRIFSCRLIKRINSDIIYSLTLSCPIFREKHNCPMESIWPTTSKILS